jgi:hypothetical protein
MTQPTVQSGAQSEPTAQAQKGPDRRHQAEKLAEEALELWRKVAAESRRPSVGAVIAGVAVLAAGAVWGATEAAVAAIAAYAVFRMLRKRANTGEVGERNRAETQAHNGPTRKGEA